MKKHTLKISTMSVLCVLCAGLTTNAMAAGTVRALGGAGTYNGTSAASTATRSAPARAGSLRVSPASAKLVKSNSSATTSGAATSGATQRLSIGKYLGGATTTAGAGSAGGSTPGSSSSNVGVLEQRIEALEGNVGAPNAQAGTDTLAGRIAAIEDQIDLIEVGGVQGSADGVVEVSGTGTVSVNVDKLMDKLEEEGAILSSRETEVQYTSGHDLQWRYTSGDDQTWHTLLNTDTLTGDYATAEDISDAIDGLSSTYATKSELNAKANASDVYTKGEVDAAIATGVSGVNLSAYETAEHASATYQPKGSYATTEQLAGKADASALNDYMTSADAAAAYQPKGSYATTEQLAGKADASALNDYATTDAMQAAIAQAQLDGQVDLSAYETAAQAEAKYQPKGEYATSAQLNAKADASALNDYMTSADAAAAYQPKGEYATAAQLNAKQDTINDLATIIAGAAAGATAVQPTDLSDYAKTEDLPVVPTAVSAFTNDAGYLTSHQSLEGYAKTADLPVVPTAVSAFTNDAGYLVANPANPTTSGDYMLKLNKNGDTYTYSWAEASTISGGDSGSGSGGSGSGEGGSGSGSGGFEWDDDGWGTGE